MLAKDYVCGMEVDSDSNQVTYKGGRYAFCSKQCQERFLASPHLYIGVSGQMAPKQEGVTVIKQRRMRLAQPLSSSESEAVCSAVQSMMGIKDISAEGDSVCIRYDLLEATAEQIEKKLEEVGVQLGGGLSERLRRAFVHYEEECEIGNLEARKPSCCRGPES